MEHKSFFYKRILLINFFSTHNEVDSTTNCFCSFKVCAVLELRIIISVKFITANSELLQKFRISNLSNISISVVLFITGSIVIHCLLQSGSNSNIVNNKPAFFITEYTVYTSNCLHKIVSGHRFIYIHSGKRRNIKSCQPHINNNRNFHSTAVIFEFLCKLILMVFITDNLFPFFWVIVAGSHNNTYLFSPSRSKF